MKKHWLDKILAGEKKWEIRGSSTSRRGWIHLAQSKTGGKLVGRARLLGCTEISRSHFLEHIQRHHVTDLADVPYAKIFAWEFADAERFTRPFVYEHRPGAVVWVRV